MFPYLSAIIYFIWIIYCSYTVNSFLIAVHAGAGSYNRTLINIHQEIRIKEGILEALRAGYNELKYGNGNHLSATREAIIKLEDNPLFNAGKGAKINREFEVECDASIMDGETIRGGAVAATKHIKNPIKAAELVMKNTSHILLVSNSADKFAKEMGLDMVSNYYFFTKDRVIEWIEAKTKGKKVSKMGTVGAVALDSNGHLAAATSTGGITYKMAGRVGDSPIIGAGNYANDKTVAVSCTGEGEVMMRTLMAFDIHAKMLYKGQSLKEASKETLSSVDINTGGFIAIDKEGNVEMPFNTSGMARGYVTTNGKAFIYIFNEGEDFTPSEYIV